jgi:hypothetical protein
VTCRPTCVKPSPTNAHRDASGDTVTTYRTGNHWGVTIVRETTDHPRWAGTEPQEVEPDSELVAVVVNGDQALAERICTLLNGAAGSQSQDWPAPEAGVDDLSGSQEPDAGSVALVKGEAYQRLGDRLWYRASRRANPGLTWHDLNALGGVEVIHHA